MRHRTYGGVRGRGREAPPTRLRQAWRSDLVRKHEIYLGGASPLSAVEIGRTSLGKGVHREVESEGSR